MNEQREMIRSQMSSKPAWFVGSSAYGSLGLLSQTSSYSPVHGLNLRRCNSMEAPSPFMSGDERSDSMSVSSVYSSMTSPSEADEAVAEPEEYPGWHWTPMISNWPPCVPP